MCDWREWFEHCRARPTPDALTRKIVCVVQGRVVGVNTAIFTNTGTSAGVGFAIPIDIVRSIVPQLIQYGKVVRPALNIQVTATPTSPPSSLSSCPKQGAGLPPQSAAVRRRMLTGSVTVAPVYCPLALGVGY